MPKGTRRSQNCIAIGWQEEVGSWWCMWVGLQANLQKTIAGELEWLGKNAKGQQKKGKARLRRYEDLLEEVHSPGPPPYSIKHL